MLHQRNDGVNDVNPKIYVWKSMYEKVMYLFIGAKMLYDEECNFMLDYDPGHMQFQQIL